MLAISKEVQKVIAAVTRNAYPGSGEGFAARVKAIELLEIHVLDRLRYLGERIKLPKELRALAGKAKDLRRQFEAANRRDLEKLRKHIRSGRTNPKELNNTFIRYAGPPGKHGGYDTLDPFAWGLLGSGKIPKGRSVLEPEMVGNQPVPVREILSLIKAAKIRPNDIFYDLGSGLGQVVMLVALLTGATARGIEFDPAYCSYAKRCAGRLKIPLVEFIHGDVRGASLEDGTVYFLYTPFRGAILRLVLDRLRGESRKRRIKVCAFGPCTLEVAKMRWLKPEGGRKLSENEVAVFQSK